MDGGEHNPKKATLTAMNEISGPLYQYLGNGRGIYSGNICKRAQQVYFTETIWCHF